MAPASYSDATRQRSVEHQDNTPVVPPISSAPAKQPQMTAKSVDSHSVTRRLQSELMALMMSGEPGISAFPEGDNIFCWKGTITGSKDTVYEGMVYRLSLTFSTEYPFKPPKVKFDTMCFHPNVDTSGNICLDILQDKWSSAYDVRTILLSIQSLLGEPNNDSPLNTSAAALWSNQEGTTNLAYVLLAKESTLLLDERNQSNHINAHCQFFGAILSLVLRRNYAHIWPYQLCPSG